ncbi:MAG: glycosyltransferase family 2 protein, partial [Anaerolineales bacterium]
MTDISVIIPVHNGGAQFRECLTALTRSTPPPHELIVVDDGSTDGSADLAAQHGARVLRTARPGGGPAVARNLAAQAATGDVLFFCDADVAVRPDTLARIAAAFETDPDLTALFGSYDDAPSDPGLISQYKNLFHHYVHQHGAEDASTFWSGCGAIRRDAFLAAGGFSPRYRLPSIEDIELGYTLKRAGHRIRLDKALQVKHLKRWTLRSLLHSDIVARGVPWTRLILRERAFLNDLNLQTHNRTSVVVVYLGLLCTALGLLSPAVWIGVPAAALVLLLLNRRLYRFFAARRDARFAAAAAGLHWLYYSYNGISFGVGLVLHVFAGMRDWSLATDNSQIRDPHSEITIPRSPMTTFLPVAIFLVTWLAYLAIMPTVLRTWKITGDEPHYLLAAHSLAFDHDLNLRDNYERRDYAAFYALPFLDRHVAVQPDGSERLTHDIGLPVVIAPAYWLGGRTGVMHLFAITGALLAVQMFLLGWEVSGRWWAGLAGWLGLAFSAPLVNYVFLIYPEALGGLLVIWALRRILNTPAWRPLPTTNYQSPISVGNWRLVIGDWIALPAAVAALPWLSGRFAPLLALLAALTIWKFRARAWLPIAGTAALSLLVYLLINYTTYGSPTPSVTVAGAAVGAGFSNVGALQIGR